MQFLVQGITKTLFWLCLFGFLPHAQAEKIEPEPLRTEIRWTSYGVPHIKAQNELGLGYGVGYAYARDNACLLAKEVVTVRGELARYFGADGQSTREVDNVSSDIFFTWFNDPEQLAEFWQAQPREIQQLLSGYAEGFNRYLNDAGKTDSQPPLSCWGEPWLRPIAEEDMVRLVRRLLVEGGLGQFIEPVVMASPPSGIVDWLMNRLVDHDESSQSDLISHKPWPGELELGFGSNAIAVGRERSENGKGLLLANPHFPWQGDCVCIRCISPFLISWM